MRENIFIYKIGLLFLILSPLYAGVEESGSSLTYWLILGFIVLALIFVLYRYSIIEEYSKNLQQNIDIIDKHVLISYSDKKGNITYVSEALCKLTGYTKEELIGKNHRIFKHPDTPRAVFKKLWQTITQGEVYKGELKNINKAGKAYWIEVTITPIINKYGEIEGYSAIRQDITDKKYAQKLSITDKLTQTYNRLHLENILAKETQRANRYGEIYSVIIIDIDKFKLINDNYGHDVGDKILISVVEILNSKIRQTDVLGRWGGEEFLIICPKSDMDQAYIVAQKLRVAIQEHEFPIIKKLTCSFGVSQYRSKDKNSDAVIKKADEALYISKENGRNMVSVKY
ncbi:hypothetical protein M947_07995 [Sulfurimonas hongkongensis]|uniref:Diguanylate cyclase n=1 Tax=Sulfurimonas hongkongensis TaxID=1172190 RepID=T0KZT8_9BACT|nr:GGDEF domain-containing protein [Sulfurimonas hongkongensis]EQB39093.1 hypothetical protein M947_07995 [Sulfurimonas hongkongensis]